MFRRSILIAAALALVPAIPTAAATDGAHRVFELHPLGNSGQHGTVTFTAAGNHTKVVIALVGPPAGVPEPAHIHPGSCAKLDPRPKYSLTNVVDGYSETDVPVPYDSLMGSDMAVNVHESAKNIINYVACGDLK